MKYMVYAVAPSGLGGPRRVHDYGRLTMHWGVSGAYETDSRAEADAMAARATQELGEPCVRSDLWVDTSTADYSPNFGGVLT